ncbi:MULTISPECIES: hypothetical protein [Serratia]|uniref:hypothetical protein n=1 Tax=Serratia TaxID=613 RepID=UPI000744F79E|nr:hypothetical protein [Serratia marcescens]CUZ28962.1 Uncharacterised protein [Serratia marcescens]CVH72553.1 Uncharacterised protein [Serratia marcescens]
MRKVIILLVMVSLLPTTCLAAFRCGNWLLDVNKGGETTINGQVTNTQKVKFLGKDGDYANMKLDMVLAPASDGNMYGFEFIKRAGKAFLNVELLRTNMDAPRVFGTYDCNKIG